MSQQQAAPRRQWGAETRSEPMSIMHPVPGPHALTWGRIGMTISILCWLGYVITTVIRELLDSSPGFGFTMEAVSYVVVVTLLSGSSLIYLITRQGAVRRFKVHQRVPRGILDAHFGDEHGAMTVLVPSYAEEPDVVRLTLWSAALQEYPDLRLVLLLDDPPHPTDAATAARLEATRSLASEIETALAVPYERAASSAAAAEADLTAEVAPTVAVAMLAAEYLAAASWLEEMAASETIADHVSEFFVDQVLRGLANELRLTELGLREAAAQRGEVPSERVRELYRRLQWIFRARLSNFERKRYDTVPLEANKAMNINAYLGLMGGRWRPVPNGPLHSLRRLGPGEKPADGDLDIEATEYLLTLDADSQLLRDYCLRLVYFLEQAENHRVAIVQTPYSSYRGAPTRIERIAGASTDIQHILHQGMTFHHATFWVGANAVIRRRALDDIVQIEHVGGIEIRTYVQDRTVIEDTESSIDMAAAGWGLVNYPERLSYSATPPDFGSLVVQRRRWANGGLLILPKFLAQRRSRARQGNPVRFGELLLRVNYMASIAWSSVGLVFLLFYPYDSRLLSPFVVGAALPYFIAMAIDLRYCGHRYLDILRIYGFNLVLLPVNLAGVLKSLQQAFTGEKIPFARTPKVRNRTAAPALYVVVPYLIVGYSLLTAWRSYRAEEWPNFAFAVFNAVLAAWAIRAYIGIWNSLLDMGMGLLNWILVPRRPKPAPAPAPSGPKPVDWATILYHGDRRLARDVRRRNDRRRRFTPDRTRLIDRLRRR